MSDVFDEAELETELKKCPEWEAYENTIYRTIEFEEFMEGIDFVNTLAELADEAQHHPEININHNVVTVTLTTNEEDGVTPDDIEMAQRIDNLVD